MPRSYRFGKVYACLNFVFAAYSAWFAAYMLWYGYFWAAVLSASAVPLECVVAIGLWRKRLYGFYLLCFSFLAGFVFNFYGWVRSSGQNPIHHFLFTLSLY